MRSLMVPALTAAMVAAAAPAFAQADRYGGYAAYPNQAQQAAPVQPSRVLTWPGKTIPVAPPAQPQLQPQAAAPYGQARPAYPPTAPAAYYAPPPQPYAPAPQAPPQPQQALQLRPAIGYAPPRGGPYPVQPYYAPPAAPSPAPGSTATAPNGVYPAGGAPPQLAYPMGSQFVGAQPQNRQPSPPASIYAPPPPEPAPQAQAQPGSPDPHLPQRVAMNTAESARIYSVHREFGMTPDPTPPSPPQGQAVELVSPIDSSQPDPDGEVDRPTTRRITDASGKTTVVRTRGSSSGAGD